MVSPHAYALRFEAYHRRGGRTQRIEVRGEDDGRYALHYQGQQHPLPLETAVNLFALLKSLDVSCPPRLTGGFDGVDYSLTLGSFFNSLTFKWWMDMVDENWQPLLILREKLYALCRQYFGAAAAEL